MKLAQIEIMNQTHSSLASPAVAESGKGIRTFPNPTCYMCETEGIPAYADLRDRISTAEGEWSYKRCRNPECGLWWLDPMPHPEDIGKAYEDYFTHDATSPANPNGLVRRIFRMAKAAYMQQRFGYSCESTPLAKSLGKIFALLPNRSNYVDASIMYLSACSGGRLLDVGCGSGTTLRIMQDLGWDAEGIDFDPITVENARSKCLNVHLGTLQEQQYNDDSFDAVVMCHVIEHVHDPLGLIRECRRVLKPNGRLVILTPNIDSRGHRRFQRAWLFLDPPRHLHLFNRATLTELAAKAGLETLVARTSARTSGRMVIGSREIARCGRHDLRKPLSVSFRFFSEVVELVEEFYRRLDSSVGEELVFIASKRETDSLSGRGRVGTSGNR
jgi:2-polyprenyl-3-methyl-5-hydroxy-6-metoxy-1,4-benzoquinol methylase